MPYVDGNYVSFIYNLQQSPRLLKLCGGGTTKSNSNELPISVPLSFACSLVFAVGVALVVPSVKVDRVEAKPEISSTTEETKRL